MGFKAEIMHTDEDIKAAELLEVLKHSQASKAELESRKDTSAEEATLHSAKSSDRLSQSTTLLDMVYNNTIINSVVELYDGDNKKRAAPSVHSTSEEPSYEGDVISADAETAQTSNGEIRNQYNNAGYVSKRQKISEAIARSRVTLIEYKLNMSIESKKKVITCLHLLKLANRQLNVKVSSLQDMVDTEHSITRSRRESKLALKKRRAHKLADKLDHHEEDVEKETSKTIENPDKEDEKKEESNINEALANVSVDTSFDVISGDESYSEDEKVDEEFFDASEMKPDEREEIERDVVCMIKKVYSVISKFAGNSLPEPARSKVRESLLQLPNNLSQYVDPSIEQHPKSCCCNSELCLTANCKVLLLAKESLDMVRNVMVVLDSSLGKAEEWVKQRQEFKQQLKERLLMKQNQYNYIQNEQTEK